VSGLWTLLRSYLGARRRFHRLRGTALAKYQDDRARAVVAHAMRRSPFYRDHFAGRDPRDWRTLPIVDKAMMMANFDTFNTRGIRLADVVSVALSAESRRDPSARIDGLTVGLSSGTSGHRGVFLVSEDERLRWAGIILARGLGGLLGRRRRIALFLRSNSNLYESLGSRRIDFRFFDLMTPLADAVRALNQYQPDLLAGPPSLLTLLADARVRGDLSIRPERVVSVAEVLEPQDEARLAGVFDVPVQQVYQCTEGLLALSCAHGSLHIQEDIVVLQLEPAARQDADPPPAGPERRWTPIVTDLWRRTQPIIRYRLNDVLTLAPAPCPCGSAFRVIARIEGRCDDICYLVTPSGEPRPFFPDALRRIVLLAHGGIEDYQVFQDSPGQLRVHLQVAAATDFGEVAAALGRTVEENVIRHGCRMPVLQCERGLASRHPGEKLRRVRRLG
jgi:putative adenylate-forming enzyme